MQAVATQAWDLRRYWESPDDHFAPMREASERGIAWFRFVSLSTLIVVSTPVFLRYPGARSAISLEFLVVGLSVSCLLHVVLEKGWLRGQLPFLAVTFELALSAVVLLALSLGNSPIAGTNDRVVYSIMLFYVCFNWVRLDPRVCIFAALLATLLYGGVVAVAAFALDAPHHGPDPVYGTFSWWTQVARLLMFVLAGAATLASTRRVIAFVSASCRDELTGLLNRRMLDQTLSDCFAAGRPFTLLLMDVDHFKHLNDSEGHAAGDAALRQLASLIRRSFRTTDVASRYGGEEFALLLPGGDPQACLARAVSLCLLIASTPLHVSTTGREGGREGRQLPPVTVSIGVASWPGDGSSPRAVMQAADERMYEAKRRGRNRVVGPELGAQASALQVAPA